MSKDEKSMELIQYMEKLRPLVSQAMSWFDLPVVLEAPIYQYDLPTLFLFCLPYHACHIQ